MRRLYVLVGRFNASVAVLLSCGALAAAITVVMHAAELQAPETGTLNTQNQPPVSSSRDSPKSGKAPANSAGRVDGYLAGGRWREGSKLVDIPGQFRIAGDRVAFQLNDGKTRFACLENLNSERIARVVSESPETLEWVVQGTITEFRNENYLLVTQGVIRNRGAREPRPGGDRPPTATETPVPVKQR